MSKGRFLNLHDSLFRICEFISFELLFFIFFILWFMVTHWFDCSDFCVLLLLLLRFLWFVWLLETKRKGSEIFFYVSHVIPMFFSRFPPIFCLFSSIEPNRHNIFLENREKNPICYLNGIIIIVFFSFSFSIFV